MHSLSQDRQTRRRFTIEQKIALEQAFKLNRHLTAEARHLLASMLSLKDRDIQIWFQNRRAKERRIESENAAAVQQHITSAGTHSNSGNGHHGNRSMSVSSMHSPIHHGENTSVNSVYQSSQLGSPPEMTSSHENLTPDRPYVIHDITDIMMDHEWPNTPYVIPLSQFQVTEFDGFLDFASMEVDKINQSIHWIMYQQLERIKIVCPVNSIKSVKCFINRDKDCHLTFDVLEEPTFFIEMDEGSNVWFPISNVRAKRFAYPTHPVAVGKSKFILPFLQVIKEYDHLQSSVSVQLESDANDISPEIQTLTGGML